MRPARTKNQPQKPSRALVIGATISALFMLMGLIIGLYSKTTDDRLLAESGAYAIGKVTRIVSYKGKNVTCTFTVAGKRYEAHDKAYDASDPVYVGDQFYILYYIKNPDINRIMFDKRAD